MSSPQSKALKWILLVLRIGMGLMFVYAAWTKLREPWIQVAMTVEAYQLLPPWAVEVVARTLPWGELLLGVWLLVGKWLRLASLASTGLLLAFIVVLTRSYLKGMQIDCGCFGDGDPISPLTLARDGSLFAASLAMTILAFRAAKVPIARDEVPVASTQATDD
jgi:uncharacterized membrane protein YphA (DoxX/SURF4 family)